MKARTIMQFDTIIESVKIYDGTGRSPFVNNLGIKGDKIAAIGKLEGAEATRRINAQGLALSPGFIDVHSHADMSIHKTNHASLVEPLLRQGITTFVGGNCGVSMAPISDEPVFQMLFYEFFLGEKQEEHIHWKNYGEFFEHLETQGMHLNGAFLTGHGILRMDAMGDSVALADVPAIKKMKFALAESLEAGSIGLSTGLQYFPGLNSDQWELTELARVVHDYNGVFTSHMRSFNSDTVGRAVDEVVDIGQDADVPVQISHLYWIPNFPGKLNTLAKRAIQGLSKVYSIKPFPMPSDSGAKVILERIDRLVQSGRPVGVDAMPTSAGFTHLLAFLPPWALTGGIDTVRARLESKETRKEIRKSIEEGDLAWPHRGRDSWSMNILKVMGWDSATVMSVVSEKNQDVVGKNFVQIGKERGVHPFDAICDLLLEEDAKVLIFITMTDPADPFMELSLKGSLIDKNTSIVTDSILLGFGKPSHLFYDCYPKFLSVYAKEKGFLPMEEAIRKCTSLPAKQLQLHDRGEIREGAFADIVLFDETTLATNATPTDPAHFPTGIEYVFVNGYPAVTPEGYDKSHAAGRILRK